MIGQAGAPGPSLPVVCKWRSGPLTFRHGPESASGSLRPLVPQTLFMSIRLALSFFLVLVSPFAQGHFNLDLNIRTIHVVHTDTGLEVYLRLPTPLFLAHLVGEVDEDGIPAPAPFTYNRVESGRFLHYLDLGAIREAPLDFASLAERGHRFSVDGTLLKADILDVGLHPGLEQPPFSTLEEAKRSLEGQIFPYDYPEVYVGATVTDLLLHYRYDSPIDTYDFQSTFDPGLEGQEDTANLVLDHFPGNVQVHRLTGLLNDPVQIRNSQWAAVSTFAGQGIIHILEGLDHVLYILCLTVGATGLFGLLWRVTGFTLGHTITLILGFFGYVPSGVWFVPAVETAISLTILYAASMILLSRHKMTDSVVSYVITTGIGLIHGLGFSFILHEMLVPGGAHLWKSLLAFNLGVEIGQVLIVVCVWLTLWFVARMNDRRMVTAVQWTVALPCIVMASYWTVERGFLLADTLLVSF